MTAATVEGACPKCSGDMWDNRVGKKNPKAPDFKCKDRACEGVIWPPKGAKPTAPPKSPPSFANKPDSSLPPLLQNQEEEDRAELAAKIGDVPPGLDRKALIAWNQRQSLAVVLDVYEPMFVAKNIGLTDETVHKLSFELFKTWSDKGLVG